MTDKMLKAVALPGDFIFHSSWFEIFKSFDMATAYAIFMAMITYVQTGTVTADEELRRLTVFLFAHIDTDRQRILSLQPKRRTTAKKKPATEAPAPDPAALTPETSPEPTPETSTPAPEIASTPTTTPTSAISDTSAIPDKSQSSHNSHNSHPKTDGSLTPRMRATRRASFLQYAQRVSAAIRQGQHLPDPTRVHKRIYKKRFTKHPSKPYAQPPTLRQGRPT